MDLGGPYYNTNAQAEALEALLRKLPDPTTPAPPPANRPKPGRAVQLNADQVHKLMHDYAAGATTSELGNRFGINRRTVSAILQRNNIQTRYRRLTPEQIDQAVRYHQAGWPLGRIGERLGVDPTTVLNRLRDRGVPTRDPQGRPRP